METLSDVAIIVVSCQVMSGQMAAERRGRVGVMMGRMAGHGQTRRGMHAATADVPISSSAPAVVAGLPLALLGVEDEPGVGQPEGLLVRHGRLLALLEQAVAVALGVDPVSCIFKRKEGEEGDTLSEINI
jgi:hypothetical protein